MIRISQIRQRNEIDVGIYISDNKNLFRKFFQNKEAIEKERCLEFDWRELPNKKASRIVITKKVSFDAKNEWNNQFDWLIDAMIKMKKIFVRYF